MRLKVEQVYPGTPEPTALVSEMTNQSMAVLLPGHMLRCGGYQFEIVKVHGARSSNQLGLQLKGDFGIRPGMILRPSNAPVADDEFVSMMMRLTHILQTVCELSAHNVLKRLNDSADEGDVLVRHITSEGNLQVAVDLFKAMTVLKESLPSLDEQRKFGSMAEELNGKLSVMQLSGSKVVTLGS